MARTARKTQKKFTKNPLSPSTRKSNASTPTSRSSSRQQRHKRAAQEILRQSLRATKSALQDALVEGVSMWPLLREGYKIRFRALAPETLEPGDLIVLRSFGRRGEPHLRVHRLIGRAGPFFVEAGDNTFEAALVEGSDILGRVETAKDLNGRAVNLLARPPLKARFRYFLLCAQSFMLAHECKNRMLGKRRSLLLWRLSQAYRAGLGSMGLRVPAIPPR